MVSYEAWGAFYLRFSRRLRPIRLLVPALGTALLGLWSPVVAVVLAAGLLALVSLEGWVFGRRVRRTLVSNPKEGSYARRRR